MRKVLDLEEASGTRIIIPNGTVVTFVIMHGYLIDRCIVKINSSFTPFCAVIFATLTR